jgi:hypothetical protein
MVALRISVPMGPPYVPTLCPILCPLPVYSGMSTSDTRWLETLPVLGCTCLDICSYVFDSSLDDDWQS